MPTATADPTTVRSSGADEPVRRPALREHVDHWTSAQMPAQSYVAFRVAFGLLVAYSQVRFLARGWVEEFYLAPTHHLTYPGFGWVEPLPGPAMYGLVGGLAVLGLLIACGVRTRAAAGLFAIGFAYCELIDAALYLNHYWFITLAAVLLALLPGPAGGSISAVTVWALRMQIAVVYVFAGMAKLNHDWLLRAEPLQTWLAARTDRPLIGWMLDEPVVAFAFSWAGAAFDLTIVGWLLWKRSRPISYAVLVVFHVATAALFQIGVFPWVMIALTPILFSPTWPARITALVRPAPQLDEPSPSPRSQPSRVGRATAVALAVLLCANIALPLRHLAADGNVRWNDDGYLLSWRVMLTERASDVDFHVIDPTTGIAGPLDAATVLTEWQAASALVRADLILATAHLMADVHRAATGNDLEVRADAVVAWNGRLRAQWIDPDVDLAALPRSAPASNYVLAAPSDD